MRTLVFFCVNLIRQFTKHGHYCINKDVLVNTRESRSNSNSQRSTRSPAHRRRRLPAGAAAGQFPFNCCWSRSSLSLDVHITCSDLYMDTIIPWSSFNHQTPFTVHTVPLAISKFLLKFTKFQY